MTTPICDFVRAYAEKNPVRLHMPGHKGITETEKLDITEFSGADNLYCPDGIIAQSESNAGKIFGAYTFYSTEGSSLCIRAMLLMAVKRAGELGCKPLIMAARNVHRTFLSAAALLDFDILWLDREGEGSYLCCDVSASRLDAVLCSAEQKPVALYLTSPDYLGSIADIKAIAEVCHKHGILLLVDNAHGAYLKFLNPSRHPIDLGADACCDSAHKTLSALTGTAYLHISENAPELFAQGAKSAMLMFASTSPSYLLLESLDALNAHLDGEYRARLFDVISELDECRQRITEAGYSLIGSEPLKLTLAPKSYGYEGWEIEDILLEHNIVCEFADRDFTVMMFTPEISAEQIQKVTDILCAISRRTPIVEAPPPIPDFHRVMSPREAMLSPSELLPISDCVDRILAEPSVSCPPAVPILVCGEKITSAAVECFEYYGVSKCAVVKETRSSG